MDEKIVFILNEMSEYLSIAQMKKLQEVMIEAFVSKDSEKKTISNDEYLLMFLEAKKIEGCSDRTIQYYRMTIERLLRTVTSPVRKITTEDIRSYLSGYQNRNDCSKVIDKGMPIEQVQKILGHSQIDTTMQYAMVNQTNVKSSHQKYIA